VPPDKANGATKEPPQNSLSIDGVGPSSRRRDAVLNIAPVESVERGHVGRPVARRGLPGGVDNCRELSFGDRQLVGVEANVMHGTSTACRHSLSSTISTVAFMLSSLAFT